MPRFTVAITQNARNDIQKLAPEIAIRIQKKLDYFVNSGKPLAFAQRLTKLADSQYRWRIGDYRVLFDFEKQTKTISILKIQHRREVYRK